MRHPLRHALVAAMACGAALADFPPGPSQVVTQDGVTLSVQVEPGAADPRSPTLAVAIRNDSGASMMLPFSSLEAAFDFHLVDEAGRRLFDAAAKPAAGPKLPFEPGQTLAHRIDLGARPFFRGVSGATDPVERLDGLRDPRLAEAAWFELHLTLHGAEGATIEIDPIRIVTTDPASYGRIDRFARLHAAADRR